MCEQVKTLIPLDACRERNYPSLSINKEAKTLADLVVEVDEEDDGDDADDDEPGPVVVVDGVVGVLAQLRHADRLLDQELGVVDRDVRPV